MNRTRALALFAAAAAITGGAQAQAATWLTVGPSDLCGSDGCFAGQTRTYTQTFSAAGRGGVVDISQLAVLRDLLGSKASNAVKVSFQLADGTEVSWGKFTVAALGGDVVTLRGQQIAWDTALGDLTVKLDLIVPDKGGGFGGGGFGGGGFGGGGGGGSSVDGGDPPFTPPGGIVADGRVPIDFGDILPGGGPLVRPALPPQPSIGGVPEPGAWALMIMGFGAAGAMLRRRKAYHLRYG